MPKKRKRVKKINKKIKRMRKAGGNPMNIQALKEKKRSLRGKAATLPGDVAPGGYGTAGDWASDMALKQGVQGSQLGAPTSQKDMYGNEMRWTINPETGEASSEMVLGDQQQQALQGQQGFQDWQRGMGQQAYGQAGQAMSQPYSSMYQGMPQMPGQQGMSQYRQDIEQKLYDSQARLAEPQMQQERENFEQMAAERGWSPGSKVYQQEKDRMEQNQSSTRQGWMSQATQQGLGEMQGMYGMSAQDRQRMLGEAKDQRYGSYQEAQQMMGGAGGPQQGQFQQAKFGQVAPQNFGNMATNFAQLEQNPYMKNLDYQNAVKMYNLQNSGGGGGGGMSPEEQAANRDAQIQAARDQAQWEIANGIRRDYRVDQGGSGGTDWAGIAGGVAGGVGNFLGSYDW